MRSVQQRLPEPAIVRLGLQRRIHLDQRSQPRIVVDVEEQMVRTHFAGDQLVMHPPADPLRRRSIRAARGIDAGDERPGPSRAASQSRPPVRRGSANGRPRDPCRHTGPYCGAPSSHLRSAHRSAVSSSAKIRSKASWSSTSRSPVLEPMKILMPGVRRAAWSCARLSGVAPI